MGDETKQTPDDLTLITDEKSGRTGTKPENKNRSGSTPKSSIENSARTYQDINKTLGNFYEKPKEDPEKERLQKELDELKAAMSESNSPQNSVDNQLELMEKSFQMAAKYMPASGTSGTNSGVLGTANSEPQTPKSNVSGKTAIVPVKQVEKQTVSSLHTGNFENHSQGFLTATATKKSEMRNTISACVHENQTVLNGQAVRLRLLEPMQAGNRIIPRNTVVSGTAKIQGERLDIPINSFEYSGIIIPVELTVYDTDGQRGIFIPDLQELNAAKEVIANMGTSAGTSVNLSNDAKQQFIADMGRSVIQGVSQFTAKKLREVKVHLKSGYKIYLISETQLKNSLLQANK